MPQKPLSLRFTATTALAAVAALALLACGALISSTTALRRSTATAAAAAESVRLAEEAQIELLLHARAVDGVVKLEIETEMFEQLALLEQFVSSEDERNTVAEARAAADRYLSLTQRGGTEDALIRSAHATVFAALEQLVSVNLAQANDARREAAALDTAANVLGIVIPILVLLLGAVALLWLRNSTIRPVIALAAAMDRFAKGERDVHANEIGPAELQLMSRRFNQMASTLADRRKAQMAFLGGVAHDLRNPLSALKMAAQLGVGRELSGEKARQLFERVLRQTERLERMLGDLIDSARIEAGELELRQQTCDLRKIATDVVGLFEDTSAKHELSISVPQTPVEVSCDPLRIEQVLTNLLSNAIKYSPDGGVVDVSVRHEDGAVKMTVRDRGLGMSEDHRLHLFEPFRRGDSAAVRDIPGVGLGLHVTSRIVEAHGGRIEVQSALGEGSTVTVVLPTDLLQAEATPGAASPAPSRTR